MLRSSAFPTLPWHGSIIGSGKNDWKEVHENTELLAALARFIPTQSYQTDGTNEVKGMALRAVWQGMNRDQRSEPYSRR